MMNTIEYIKENPRKIVENLTSYLTIATAIGAFIIAEGAGFGADPLLLAKIGAITAITNRMVTYLRVTYLKDKMDHMEFEQELECKDEEPEDDFIME